MRKLVLALVLSGCSSPPSPQPPPPMAPSPDAAVATTPLDAAVASLDADPVVDDAAPAPVACRSDQRRFGSACCDVERRVERHKFPGMTTLTCRGPRIGLPCRKKDDCDIGCSCDRSDHLSPGNGPQGPADGTRGVVGHCAGSQQIGVWMCRVDETGKVTHLIID